MNTVIITGVAGFLGRYIARQFASEKWSVIGIDHHANENAPLRSLHSYHAIRLPSTAFGALVKQVQPALCIHCAGRASVPQSVIDPAADFAANASLTFDLLDTLRTYAPSSRVVFMSSAAVYGNPVRLPITEEESVVPLSPYGFHKSMSEQLLKEFHTVYGLRGASLRIFSAYGPGLRRQVLWDFCYKALIEKRIVLQGTGQETRDFIHAIDVAKATLAIAKGAPMIGEVYNVASGEEITIRALAEKVLEQLRTGLVPETDGIVPTGTPRNWRADISKLRALGYQPSIQLEIGIERFSSWASAELLG